MFVQASLASDCAALEGRPVKPRGTLLLSHHGCGHFHLGGGGLFAVVAPAASSQVKRTARGNTNHHSGMDTAKSNGLDQLLLPAELWALTQMR